MSPLGRWSWMHKKAHWKAMKSEPAGKFLYGVCFSSCLKFPALNFCPDFLADRVYPKWYNKLIHSQLAFVYSLYHEQPKSARTHKGSIYAVCFFSLRQLFYWSCPRNIPCVCLNWTLYKPKGQKENHLDPSPKVFGFPWDENRRQNEAGQIRKLPQSSSSEKGLAQGQKVRKTGVFQLLLYLLMSISR